MRDDETYDELTRMFAAEDAKLSTGTFTQDVMKRIRRQALIRRMTIGAFSFLGALVALLQLPELLSAFVGVDHTVSSALAMARTEINTAASSNPLWIAVTGVAALTMTAVTLTERA